ncbi:MAG: DMT family transporter [Anaerolineae bacterium]|nr:DMT family transporter [Anaerolineae bacterium]
MRLQPSAHGLPRRGLGYIVLAAGLWGTVGVTTRALYGLTETGPFSVGFFRLAFATPALLLACWPLLGPRLFQIRLRDLGVMSLIGLMLALYQVCFFAAIARVGVSIATLITLCTAPVMVALLAPLWTHERVSRPVLAALGLALAGTALLVNVQPGAAGGAVGWGILLALGSALGYAVMTLASRAVASRYHPVQITTVGFAVGALLLLPLALMSGFTVVYPALGWLLLGYLGLIPSALAYGLFMTGMRSTTATVASIVTLLEPLTATLLARLLFGEQLGALGGLGAALLLAAMVVLYRRH